MVAALIEVDAVYSSEQLLQVALYDRGIGRLAEDLQKVVVTDEVEPWEQRSFLLQIYTNGRLGACKIYKSKKNPR